jgi:hypothetical protein
MKFVTPKLELHLYSIQWRVVRFVRMNGLQFLMLTLVSQVFERKSLVISLSKGQTILVTTFLVSHWRITWEWLWFIPFCGIMGVSIGQGFFRYLVWSDSRLGYQWANTKTKYYYSWTNGWIISKVHLVKNTWHNSQVFEVTEVKLWDCFNGGMFCYLLNRDIQNWGGGGIINGPQEARLTGM